MQLSITLPDELVVYFPNLLQEIPDRHSQNKTKQNKTKQNKTKQ
ncbi:Uncharacterised protein [Candidatus Venteria ishoeyi]|uniref:Uncharacterized protein n=1 Tax=Candidatus Venteria ishoeyi TaxID=1899563 RepID=A0A1H6F723_9GAMM|nr:Uncharacterised protein [Candidatus Venteria ishoeyi]